MVEGAIVAIPFFLLVFGAVEYGFMFKDYLTVANAARAGARSASIHGDDQDADFWIVHSVDEGATALHRENIRRIVVFRSVDGSGKPSPKGSVPAACLSGFNGVSGVCNVYTPNDFLLQDSEYDCSGPGIARDTSWCPTTRWAYVNNCSSSNKGPDYVGVYIEYRYSYVTGLFSGGNKYKTLRDTSVLPLEPKGLNKPAAKCP